MGFTRRAVAVAALCVWSWAVPVARADADEVIDRVLAVAAGNVILLSDVRAARELGLVTPASSLDSDRVALSALIDRALMLDEVDRYSPREPSEADVERAFREVRDRIGSPSVLSTVMRRHGLEERQLRETLRQNLRIRDYLAQRFAADTPVGVRSAIDEWVAGLRRRADVIDRYDHR